MSCSFFGLCHLFQRELVRQHGKHAGTRRYQESLDDAETAKARHAARAARRALRDCFDNAELPLKKEAP